MRILTPLLCKHLLIVLELTPKCLAIFSIVHSSSYIAMTTLTSNFACAFALIISMPCSHNKPLIVPLLRPNRSASSVVNTPDWMSESPLLPAEDCASTMLARTSNPCASGADVDELSEKIVFCQRSVVFPTDRWLLHYFVFGCRPLPLNLMPRFFNALPTVSLWHPNCSASSLVLFPSGYSVARISISLGVKCFWTRVMRLTANSPKLSTSFCTLALELGAVLSVSVMYFCLVWSRDRYFLELCSDRCTRTP